MRQRNAVILAGPAAIGPLALAALIALLALAAPRALCMTPGELEAFSPANAARQARPFAATTLHPIRAGIFDPLPLEAYTLSPRTFEAGVHTEYASVFLVDGSGGAPLFFADRETLRLNLDMRLGIARRWDAGLGLPLASQWGGFLDSFLTEYHAYWGLPNAGREDYPYNELHNILREPDGSTVWRAEDHGLHAGDLSLWTRFNLVGCEADLPSDAALSLRAGIKFPTGARGAALSSGFVDASLGALFSARTGRLALDMNADAVFPGGYDFAPTGLYDVQPFAKAMLSVSFALTGWLALSAQAAGSSPAISAVPPDMLDVEAWPVLGVFGGQMHFGRWHVHIGFSEDLAAHAEADFSALVGVTYRFDAQHE